MVGDVQFLRRASPAEQRTICREDAGYYHAVIVGAVYDLGRDVHAQGKEAFFQPLVACINEHPWLCVVVGNRQTDESTYARVKSINLADHIRICDTVAGKDDSDAIAHVLEADLDVPFPAAQPHWRILVLPLRTGEQFVAFSYSHMIGDGLSGVCFHRTFLRALQDRTDENSPQAPVVNTIDRPLPPPFDTPERLPISWMFLLAPLLGYFLPKFLSNLLGFRSSSSIIDKGTWTATRAFFDPASGTKSQLRMIEIEASALDNALRCARAHDTKLTAVLLQLITRVLSRQLSAHDVTNFVSQTAINMRPALGIPPTEMGEYVSGCYVIHPRSTTLGPLTEDEWALTKTATRELVSAAARLEDQPIGLLRYLPSITSWTVSKIGTVRDSSIEMSNIGTFDFNGVSATTALDGAEHKAQVTKMVFAQPGHVAGPPISFNFVSVKDRGLVCSVTWQTGALGVPEDEGEFVDRVCKELKNELETLR